MHHFRLLLIVILKDSIYTNDILMAMLVECLHYENLYTKSVIIGRREYFWQKLPEVRMIGAEIISSTLNKS
ncbi:MAG: hypothetical protein K0S91_3126 [Nitrososphaeraceae archaeon]|jgi:hypothetical protein|nr:hypothetical protein [Nitrososphaeraceae archaeon]